MLETTLDAKPAGSTVTFDLRVENSGDDDVELSFSDSQRVRISVFPADEDGAKEDSGADARWRSDEGQMFMQMLGSNTVPAGESIEFQEEWEDAVSGTYLAIGEVVCKGRELQDETTFSV